MESSRRRLSGNSPEVVVARLFRGGGLESVQRKSPRMKMRATKREPKMNTGTLAKRRAPFQTLILKITIPALVSHGFLRHNFRHNRRKHRRRIGNCCRIDLLLAP